MLHIYPVLEAGDADGEEFQKAAQLRGGHVCGPALDQILVRVLDNPQETHQKIAASFGRQHVRRFSRLENNVIRLLAIRFIWNYYK